MAIERKSDLRTAELLFNAGALVSIQLTYFERLEEEGGVIPGTFNNRTVAFDPTTADGKRVIKILGESVQSGIDAKDKALAEVYAERDELRARLQVRDDLQKRLTDTTEELTALRSRLTALTVVE